MLTRIQQRLLELPEVVHGPTESHQAAVLLAITRNEQNPSLVLTKRSEFLSTHSGEVSLPGGKWEVQDRHLRDTALRETWEEVGVTPESVELVGDLPVVNTWRGLTVAPFVGLIDENTEFIPNPGELDAVFQVPLQFFLDDQRVRTDIFMRDMGNVWAPAYEYEGFEIWGFTARLIASFVSHVFELDISKDHSAPVKHWSAQSD